VSISTLRFGRGGAELHPESGGYRVLREWLLRPQEDDYKSHFGTHATPRTCRAAGRQRDPNAKSSGEGVRLETLRKNGPRAARARQGGTSLPPRRCAGRWGLTRSNAARGCSRESFTSRLRSRASLFLGGGRQRLRPTPAPTLTRQASSFVSDRTIWKTPAAAPGALCGAAYRGRLSWVRGMRAAGRVFPPATGSFVPSRGRLARSPACIRPLGVLRLGRV
jgi:hypothetical protein